MLERGFFMPKRAPSHRPACVRVTAPQYQAPERKRLSAHRRLYGRRWVKASKVYIAEHPLCEPCLAEGIVHESGVVDHKVPHRGDLELFWDQRNWQAMNKRCHDRKTATEDTNFARRGKKAP